MGAISIAKQDKVLLRRPVWGPLRRPWRVSSPLQGKRPELQAKKSGCGTGPHPLLLTAASIRTDDRRCPASGR
ncbi:hypothetical protein E8F20_22760 [Pseudomonas sp. BN415]|nr:hypothetical protein [Pseudomonas sp. BN415]